MALSQASLHTDTDLSQSQVVEWLNRMPRWHGSLDVNLSHFGSGKSSDLITCRLYDYRVWKTGSADSAIETLGSPKTIQFEFRIGRKDYIGCLDEIYRIAFGFCLRDTSCNVRLSLDDDNRGVFLRKNGRYLINPDEFLSSSLVRLLQFFGVDNCST